MDSLFRPGQIGAVELANRFVRAGTSETMAGPGGQVTPDLVALYEGLARGGVGLVLTGHLYCHPRGQYARHQTGIHDDALIPGLRALTDAVHRRGGRLFAQVAHAGSQSRIRDNRPLAPSPVPNALTGREVEEATEGEIEETIEAFATGARRAVEAGFDGVHIHGANGYLISEFASPLANRRCDAWGGSAHARDRLPVEVVRAVRAAVPATTPVTMKLGLADAVAGGLQTDEQVARAAHLVAAGLDAIEVSVNVMRLPSDSCRRYVAVDRGRAMSDLLPHRVIAGRGAAEAYFLPWARELRARVDIPIILVGGMRTTETMARIVDDGDADFIAMARPLIREPDLVEQIAAGRRGRVDCTSCNLCLMHEGRHSLRCWRIPRRRLLEHAVYRLRGGFRD
jgi:2,4-dienoyl-CoA reductase-like NADH-dependent reductase (Old Yellow Enzyme family)